MVRRSFPALAFLAVLALAIGCVHRPPVLHREAPWARYFPPVEGARYTYLVTEADLDPDQPRNPQEEKPLLVSQVTRVTPESLTIVTGGREIIYLVDDRGLRKQKSGNYLLKTPLVKGSSWPITLDGEAGAATITDTSHSLTLAGGHFPDCLVVEERIDGQPMALVTYYAPDVGVVRIETRVVIDHQDRVLESADVHTYTIPR